MKRNRCPAATLPSAASVAVGGSAVGSPIAAWPSLCVDGAERPRHAGRRSTAPRASHRRVPPALASASSVEIGTIGLPSAMASPCIAAMPTRRPVNEPGPRGDGEQIHGVHADARATSRARSTRPAGAGRASAPDRRTPRRARANRREDGCAPGAPRWYRLTRTIIRGKPMGSMLYSQRRSASPFVPSTSSESTAHAVLCNCDRSAQFSQPRRRSGCYRTKALHPSR